MVLKNIIQLAVTGAQVVGRAFNRALQQELKSSRQAAARETEKGGGAPEERAARTRKSASANARFGISLQESAQILNVPDSLPRDQVEAQYKHLFDANERAHGGTLYLQSKVYRAKERIDHEFSSREEAEKPPPPPPAEKPSETSAPPPS